MNEDHIKKYNEDAEKHNKRVKSIREKRLPKSCVKALDQAIHAMDVMTFQIQESVINATRSILIETCNYSYSDIYNKINKGDYYELLHKRTNRSCGKIQRL